MLIYGGFLFLAIFSFTTLMDKRPWAMWTEIATSLIGLTLIYLQGDWFLLNDWSPFGKYILAGWFVVSAGVSAWFVLSEFRTEKKQKGLLAK